MLLAPGDDPRGAGPATRAAAVQTGHRRRRKASNAKVLCSRCPTATAGLRGRLAALRGAARDAHHQGWDRERLINYIESFKRFIDLDTPAPDTVNPSLWRNAQLNMLYGLFKVADRIYQVRGYDLSNITFVFGNGGWIVFDPLITVETATAAYELDHAEPRPAAGGRGSLRPLVRTADRRRARIGRRGGA